MNNVVFVTFAGHRHITNFSETESKLSRVLERILYENEFVEFFVGINGDFDLIATTLIRSLMKKFGSEKCAVTLVLPYSSSKVSYYEKAYDSVIIPEELHGVHHKRVITERNRFMIDKSDLVICYVNKESGGAWQSLCYANKVGKEVILI